MGESVRAGEYSRLALVEHLVCHDCMPGKHVGCWKNPDPNTTPGIEAEEKSLQRDGVMRLKAQESGWNGPMMGGRDQRESSDHRMESIRGKDQP
jgi:hypothetical protein